MKQLFLIIVFFILEEILKFALKKILFPTKME